LPWTGNPGFQQRVIWSRLLKTSSKSRECHTDFALVGQASSQRRQKLHLPKSMLYQAAFAIFLPASFLAFSSWMQFDGQAFTQRLQEMQVSWSYSSAPRNP